MSDPVLHAQVMDELRQRFPDIDNALLTLYGRTPGTEFDAVHFVQNSWDGWFSVDPHTGLAAVLNDAGTQGGGGYIYGTGGDEVIAGRESNDAIMGMGGHDLLIGSDGHDLIVGGAGTWMYGGNGDDMIEAEQGYSAPGDTASAFIDGGAGSDVLSYGYASGQMVIDDLNHTVSFDGRVDTYVNVERFQVSNSNNVWFGSGSSNFGSYGETDVFYLKPGDTASSTWGIDTVDYSANAGGIVMTQGGYVSDAASSATGRISGVDVIIGTASNDVFEGIGFENLGYWGQPITVSFVGGGGDDSFSLVDCQMATGGTGADSFYVNLSQNPTSVCITDFSAADSLFVVLGGTTVQLTGNQLSVSFNTVSGADGSYDLLETVTGSSPFSAVWADRMVGSFDGASGTFSLAEGLESATGSQYDFFQFDPLTSSGIINLKVDGYGELKILLQNIDPNDFGLDYNSLPGGQDGTRYAGQTFDPLNPTGSFQADSSAFHEAGYGFGLASSDVQLASDYFYLGW